MRILLVEDDAILADGVAHALRAMGHAVDCMASGSDADHALTVDGKFDDYMTLLNAYVLRFTPNWLLQRL
mgnify:CR=1 FL=1